MQTIKETILFTYPTERGNEIKVWIEINYRDNLISLVNPELNNARQYVFTKRGVEYMTGWLEILECLHKAVREAKKKMEAYNKKVQDDKDNDVTEILMQATNIVKGKGKRK
jgi:hypothetical protein